MKSVQKFIKISFLVTLFMTWLLSTQTVTLAQNNSAELLRQAAAETAKSLGAAEVGAVKIIEPWAFLSFRVGNLSEDGTVYSGLAHWNGTTWEIALPDSALFATWLEQLPMELIALESRGYFQTNSAVASAAPNLRLPFPIGQTWRYLAGPNGGPSRMAVDFGPLSFNELANLNSLFTGRERDVTAAADGIVVDQDRNMLVLLHANGWETVYDSLAENSITHPIGQAVVVGERLGLASDEMESNKGLHVHFSVKRTGVKQAIAGQLLSGWLVYQDNSYEAGPNNGRLVYGQRIEKINCGTVTKYKFANTDCWVTHFGEPLVRVMPDITRLPVNGTGSTMIEVVNVTDLRQVEITLDFDPNRTYQLGQRRLVEVTASPGAVFSNSVAVSIVKDTETQIHFTATLTPTLTGSGELLKLEWRGNNIGETMLALSKVSLIDSHEQPIAATLRDGRLQVINNLVVEGRIQLPGNNYNEVLLKLGNQEFHTAADGRFTVAASGLYTLTVTAPHHLTAQVEGQASGSVNLGDITLLSGDVTGDNQINLFDLVYIGNHYNSHDTLADLNADGIVNLFDITIAAAHYGQQGPIVIQH